MSEDATLDEFVNEGMESKPSDRWAVRELSEVTDVTMGSSPKSKYYNEDGDGIPFFQSNNEFGERYPQHDRWCSNPRKIAQEGDLLMTIRGTYVGQMNIADRESCIGRGLAGITPGEKVNGEFLFQQLNQIEPFVKSIAIGSTFDSISSAEINSLEIDLPPLSEQRKIATVLYTVDRAIEKTEKIITQSERVREGITQDIFTTGYYDHSEYSDVRLGPVKTSAPKDWSIKSIPDYFEIIDGDRGKNYPSGSDFSDQGYCLFLSATNVTEEGLKFEETEFITQEKDEELRKGKLKRGDVIMTTRGTVGNFGLYDESVDYDNVRINSGMVILRPKDSISTVKYYYHLFRSGIFQRQINATSYGTAQPQTSVTDIKKMGILEPSENEKNHIYRLIENIVSEIQTQKEYRNQLQQMKRGLMQDLLSGIVRTTDTNIRVSDKIAQHG